MPIQVCNCNEVHITLVFGNMIIYEYLISYTQDIYVAYYEYQYHDGNTDCLHWLFLRGLHHR